MGSPTDPSRTLLCRRCLNRFPQSEILVKKIGYQCLSCCVKEQVEDNEREEEVVAVPQEARLNTVTSDGGSTSYYFLPGHATELRHLISYKSMSKARGDVFKACYRLGEKEGVDVGYDLKKMKFFIEDLIEMHERGEHI